MAQEIAPVGKDTINYMADGTKNSVRNIAQAVGEGFAAGAGTAHPDSPAKLQIRCHKCNAVTETDANFCPDCGESLAKSKSCPQCNELNDPDAKFCDNCGHQFM